MLFVYMNILKKVLLIWACVYSRCTYHIITQYRTLIYAVYFIYGPLSRLIIIIHLDNAPLAVIIVEKPEKLRCFFWRKTTARCITTSPTSTEYFSDFFLFRPDDIHLEQGLYQWRRNSQWQPIPDFTQTAGQLDARISYLLFYRNLPVTFAFLPRI